MGAHLEFIVLLRRELLHHRCDSACKAQKLLPGEKLAKIGSSQPIFD